MVPPKEWGQETMRQAAHALAGAGTIAAACWTTIVQAAFAPIDWLVDWLESDGGARPCR
jgi:hypothetical protein